MRRDFGDAMPKGKRIKSIAVEASKTFSQEIKKFEEIMSRFFSIPLVTYGEAGGSFDALMQIKEMPPGLVITFKSLPEMVEIGPRIRVSHLIWDLMPP
ncbi:hypothetical protein H5T51_03070 [Candidatus Bathyarchaeota archaeon]|nr:hypothetical protein [Candidatus Bathyarchaeota archaeon]